MGCGSSTVLRPQQDAATLHFDRILEEEKAEAELHFKLLTLGAGESGKSTIIKQLVFLHKQAQTSEEEKLAYVRVLHGNVLGCITTLITEAVAFGYAFSEDHARLVELVESFDSRNLLTFDVVDAIHELWAHSPAIRSTFDRRGEFWLLEGAIYYFTHMHRFTESGYSPSEEDIIAARKRTTGVVETQLKYGNVAWSVVDVGGQRSERKKWINCFDGVKGILYTVNLAGYCSVLFEDRAVNRMQESLKLFEETMANPLFADTPIFLILNKKDLFEQLIETKPLTLAFPEYTGPQELRPCIEYIANQFASRLKPTRAKPMVLLMAARVKKDVSYCLPEQDTRVLTNAGFLYLSEIESRISAFRAGTAPELLFACYDKASKQLQYGRGKVILSEAPQRWVDFTESRTKSLWGGEGSDSQAEQESAANHMSLRVTPEHRMFVQTTSRKGQYSSAPCKVPAVELTSGFRCACPAGSTDCMHGRSEIRMQAAAAQGVRVADAMSPKDTDPTSPVVRLALRDEDQLAAFLELYGAWLATGSMAYKTESGRSTSDAVLLETSHKKDAKHLKHLLSRCGLKHGSGWSVAPTSTSSARTYRITHPAWFSYFDSECFTASKEGRQRPAPQDADAKQFCPWVLNRLDREQVRLVLTGMRLADGSSTKVPQNGKAALQTVCTSSIAFRDQLVQTGLHAGFAAHFTTASAGDAKEAAWQVHFNSHRSQTMPTISTADVQYAGDECIHDLARDGRTWCIQVEHADHLIVAQRARRDAQGDVVQASLPIVIGNCFEDVKDTLLDMNRKGIKRAQAKLDTLRENYHNEQIAEMERAAAEKKLKQMREDAMAAQAAALQQATGDGTTLESFASPPSGDVHTV